MEKSAKETPRAPDLTVRGVRVYKEFLPRPAQEALVTELRQIIRAAPLFSPMTPYGKPMSVRMTSAGAYGWVSDRRGYRYARQHPRGVDWPPIPASVLQMWQVLTGADRAPECCLINYYGEGARMSMHQDRDEANFDYPVLSLSLGDDGMFRIGNTTRGGSTESVWLCSGDVVVMGQEARLVYHGIDKTRPNSSTLLPKGGRINLTLRVVT